MRSVVTITARVPAESSIASAFACNSESVPSDGFVREAYPAIHIACLGVMATAATPTFHSASSARHVAAAAATITTKTKRMMFSQCPAERRDFVFRTASEFDF